VLLVLRLPLCVLCVAVAQRHRQGGAWLLRCDASPLRHSGGGDLCVFFAGACVLALCVHKTPRAACLGCHPRRSPALACIVCALLLLLLQRGRSLLLAAASDPCARTLALLVCQRNWD
jgi:hypothetical protein